MELFSAHHIDKSYGDFKALHDVSICVEQGSIYGLLGPNGAGKTTLIRIINQIYAPDQGELLFKGRKMTLADVHDIGYLPEERGLYKKMKVGEQSIYLARLKGLSRKDAVQKLKYWFKKFDLEIWWDKKVEDLSKGMAQKLQFIITLLHDPSLLIFDEPFSGFDPINATLLRDEILELRKNGSTVIFSTHNMSSVEELCDHITLINRSKSILDGEVSEIKNRFKTNSFGIAFKGDEQIVTNLLQDNFEVLDKQTHKEECLLQLRRKGEMPENELLSLLIPHVHITSFQEILPSMNDIFIQVVGSSNSQQS